MSNPAYELLHNTPLDALLDKAHREVVTLRENQTLEDAVKALASNGIHSAPVLSVAGDWLGMIDMLDIVAHVVNVAPDFKELKEHELLSLEIAGRAINLTEIRNVMNLSGKDPFVPVYIHTPSTMAVNLFARGIHRVPVFDDSQKIVGTISQSSIVKFLSENLHMGKLKHLGERKAGELGLGAVAPITINGRHPTLEAVKLLNDHLISAVGVVNDEGRLEANFSATDLKGMFQEKWPSFLLPVEGYLSKHSDGSLKPICARPDTTLIDCCKEMISSRIHRLWVLDDSFKPSGVITMTDIMKLVVSYRE